jgi:acyl-CoA synthetase (AMP-forming)/AMP-acid ligase II
VLVACNRERHFVSSFMGCLLAGVIPVPAPAPDLRHSQATMPRIAAIANDSGALLALSDQAQSPLGLPLRWLTIDDQLLAHDRLAPDDAESPDPSVPALLQYTSGSTAEPRGVVLSHRNLLANLEAIGDATRQTEESNGIQWLPLWHDMGLIGGVLFPLYMGFPITLLSPMFFVRRPLRWLELISELRATGTAAPNFGYELCARAAELAPHPLALDLSCLEVALNGAEFIRSATLERFTRCFSRYGFRRASFQPCYGLAEAALLVTSSPFQRGPATLEISFADREHLVASEVAAPSGAPVAVMSCGLTHASTEVVIADLDTGKRCEEGSIGEILVAGPSVAQGYWRRPADTARAFGVRLQDGSGPYLRTGDLGLLRGGELFVVGRSKELIVIDGRNLYPCDLEQTIEAASALVHGQRGAVFAVQNPSGLAVVQEIDGKLPAGEDLLSTIRQRISALHHVSVASVVIVERGSLPTTSSGKVRTSEVERRFWRGELEVVAHWSRGTLLPRTTIADGAAAAHGDAP